jgi:ATP-dependent Clp protease ATP-binding subunit ClpB
MDLNRFTEKAQEALSGAQRRAARNGQQHVDVPHLLVSLLDQEQGLAPALLRKANVNVEAQDNQRREGG